MNQLWKLTDANCKLFFSLSCTGLPVFRSKPKIPVMFWPNGSVCWSVSEYLVQSSKKKKAPKGKRVSTASTSASNLSFFVRYIYRRRINLSEVTDDHINEFVEVLKEEADPNNPKEKRRTNSQVGKIVRQALRFLFWYQEEYLYDKTLIGSNKSESQVVITFEEGSNKGYKYKFINHRYIPEPVTKKDVYPIGHESITILYDAIYKSSDDMFVRTRRQNTLRLLESTGGRRLEVSLILVADILEAYKTGRLRLRTAKQKRDKERKLPIAPQWLEPIVTWINTHRKRLVRSLINKNIISQDPAELLIGVRGQPISEETITSEISILRNIAEISEKVCGHMFRHRFITIQVATRIKDYTRQTLPIALQHTILVRVAELSGHSDPMSLMPYIDLAFDELGIWDESDKVLAMRSKWEAAYRQIQTLVHQMKDKRSLKLVDKTIIILSDMISGEEYSVVS